MSPFESPPLPPETPLCVTRKSLLDAETAASDLRLLPGAIEFLEKQAMQSVASLASRRRPSCAGRRLKVASAPPTPAGGASPVPPPPVPGHWPRRRASAPSLGQKRRISQSSAVSQTPSLPTIEQHACCHRPSKLCAMPTGALDEHGTLLRRSLGAGVRCECCHESFATSVDLLGHSRSCKSNPANRCKHCHQQFPHIALKVRHQRICPTDPNRSCRFCNAKFEEHHELEAHHMFCEHDSESTATLAECFRCDRFRQCISWSCGECNICASCLLHDARKGLGNHALLPLRCDCGQPAQPGCPVDIAIARLLPEKGRLKYQAEMLRLSHDSAHLFYCPWASCGALIDLNKVLLGRVCSEEVYPCPTCQQAFCFQCLGEWHEGMTCEEFKRQTKEVVEDAAEHFKRSHWQLRCCECGHVMTKMKGSKSLKCLCGAKFHRAHHVWSCSDRHLRDLELCAELDDEEEES
eukprot:gnl/TRDRNA2_/TRDRNA2_41690_c1_seq1.p1 gnl/TRDRNA2_/TRDRNA2_41690_c1~~gnl/TRDRNA2_/TRDRNA2_41690_c1_seq1.p1  ORF type:complete len:465 (-),score=59.60 gnl/TRDRNA2_/TRDRNA2_41690_c1_seq1:256-1650(-)